MSKAIAARKISQQERLTMLKVIVNQAISDAKPIEIMGPTDSEFMLLMFNLSGASAKAAAAKHGIAVRTTWNKAHKARERLGVLGVQEMVLSMLKATE